MRYIIQYDSDPGDHIELDQVQCSPSEDGTAVEIIFVYWDSQGRQLLPSAYRAPYALARELAQKLQAALAGTSLEP